MDEIYSVNEEPNEAATPNVVELPPNNTPFYRGCFTYLPNILKETEFLKGTESQERDVWLVYATISTILLYPIAFLLTFHFSHLFKKYDVSNWISITISTLLLHLLLLCGIFISYLYCNKIGDWKKAFYFRNWKWFYIIEAIILEVALFIPLAITAIGSMAFFTFLKKNLPTDIAKYIDTTPRLKLYLMKLDWGDFALVAIVAVFIGPIIEEIICRRVIFGFFARKLTLPLALIFTSIIFAAMHFSIVNFLSLFLLATIWQLIFLYYKSLYPSIIFHMFHNCIAISILAVLKILDIKI